MGPPVCEVMMKHCMVLARIAVYKEPCQPHCDPRQYGPSGLCHRRPHERARHSLDERWGEVVQHRPDVHHAWGPALGDLLQVPWLECNIMGLYRQCYTLYVWMVLLKEGSTEALWITSALACTPILPFGNLCHAIGIQRSSSHFVSVRETLISTCLFNVSSSGVFVYS